jgi:hypothetical protein
VRFPRPTLRVIMVCGSQAHADALWDEVAAVLSPLGLRLSETKTRVCHLALLTELTTAFGQAVGGAARVPASLPA